MMMSYLEAADGRLDGLAVVDGDGLRRVTRRHVRFQSLGSASATRVSRRRRRFVGTVGKEKQCVCMYVVYVCR